MIPDIDRIGTDLPRLPGIILKISQADKDPFHQIVTKYGVLEDNYRTCDLESYKGVLKFNVKKKAKIAISMTAAAKLFSNRLIDKADSAPVCNCKGKCSDKRCKCKQKGQKCSSHCHKMRNPYCENKESK